MEPPTQRTQSPWRPPPQSADSFLPPAKRQRLSPPATSGVPRAAPQAPQQTPYSNVPTYRNFALPNAYSVQRQQMSNGFQDNSQTRPVMGPPSRPAPKPEELKEQQEKYMDINDLSDLVTTSGIDLKREEELMAASFHSQRSFNSQSQGSPQTSFDLLSQTGFGGIANRGTLSQKTSEELIYEKHKEAARAYNQSHQHHLEDPFLLGHPMRVRMEKAANDAGVKIPMEGLYDKVANKPQNTSRMSITGTDGSKIIAEKAPSILNRSTPLATVLSLISLAANERIRRLVEDAYGLARGRRITSNGVVPSEWSDIAVSANATDPQKATVAPSKSLTGTAWDAPLASPSDAPQQQLSQQEKQTTLSFPPKTSPLVKTLSQMARQERQAEEARLKKRAERRSRKAATGGGTNNLETSQSSPSTGLLGERAPEIKMTKKEREKLAKQDVSEEVATRNANTTAAMALGGNKYSWMSGSKSTPAKSSPLGAGRSTTSGVGSGGGIGAAAGSGHGSSMLGKDGLPPPGLDRKFGSWKEDGPGGRDVQLRDWVCVLEADGKDRKTLCFAYAKLGKEALQD